MTREISRVAGTGVHSVALYTSYRRWLYLAILFLVSTSAYLDRHIMSVLLGPIKEEFHVSDTMLGLLGGFCFAIFYALAGLPLARWADRGNRSTVIAVALTVWSVMTMCCGIAQTFGQLALARLGVGAGESGAIPPAQSLIADYFPVEQRATALAIFTAAATAGLLGGVGFGGYIAATHGWRTAFLVAGAPGVALAVLVWFLLDEPRLRRPTPFARDAERLAQVVRRLRTKPSFVYAFVGSLSYFFFSYGVFTFVPLFLTRVLHASLAQVSVTYAGVTAVGSLIGTLSGGILGDWLGRSDPRWLAWLPAASFSGAGVIYVFAFECHQLWLFLTLSCISYGLLSAGVPAIFATVHAVCGSQRRATAIALVLFSATLFGALGPVAIGALSDNWTAPYGVQALRYALIAGMSVLVLSGVLFYCCGGQMLRDLED